MPQFTYVEVRDVADRPEDAPMLSFSHVEIPCAADADDAYDQGRMLMSNRVDSEDTYGHFLGQLLNDYVIERKETV